MGKIRKFTGIIAAAALLLNTGCMSPFYYIPDYEKPVEPAHNEMPPFGSSAESVHGTGWYEELCESMSRFYDGGTVSGKVYNTDVRRAIYTFRSEHPDFFWAGSTYYADTRKDETYIHISYTDHLEERDIPRMYEELQQAADKLVRSVPEGSDYDKVLYVHDYITEHTVYDKKAAETMDLGLSATSYGCLVSGVAVCSGYAKAFTYIMNLLGIESGICTGSNHAWNWVKVDGKYYWLDATWDDADYIGYNAQHKFFLISDEQLLRTREMDWVQFDVPVCSTEGGQWFKEHDCYFTEYDRDTVLNKISEMSGENHCELMFADYESYAAAIEDLLGKMSIRRAKGVNVGKLVYVRCDEMYSIDLIFGGREVTGR